MNLLLNDSWSSPTYATPTNGCTSPGIADIGGAGPARVGMTPSGGGSGTNSIVIGSASTVTCLYYVGKAGDYDGAQFASGTWTIPLHLVSVSGTVVLDSIYVAHANSSGTWIETIASETGMAQTLSTTTYSFTLSGSVSSTFATGDIVVVSFQMHETASGSITVKHDQTVTTPSSSGGGNLNIAAVSALAALHTVATVSQSGAAYPPPALVRMKGVATLATTGPISYSVPTARVKVGMTLPSLGNFLAVSYAAPTALVGAIAPPRTVSMASPFAAPTSLVSIAAPPSVPSTTGTIAYYPASALVGLIAPPPLGNTPGAFHIFFKRGPWSEMPTGIPEGAPCEAGIIVGSSTFEMLYLGGHDGQNKLVGGGCQTTSGAPAFTAPAGAFLYDPVGKLLYISNGDGTWTSK